MTGYNILERIAETKRHEVEAMKARISPGILAELSMDTVVSHLSMADRIRNGSGIIAEFKRRSPSKGEIAPMADSYTTVYSYSVAGASAISILTDVQFFGGSLTDLVTARSAAPDTPLLRKDFIVDKCQIDMARISGANAILLIAALLPEDDASDLAAYAHSRGLEVLLELHNEKEIRTHGHICAEMIGINNRDLRNFNTDCDVSAMLADKLPDNVVKIAESGIKNANDVIRLRDAGFDGFLIGEALMSTTDPAKTLKQFINDLH